MLEPCDLIAIISGPNTPHLCQHWNATASTYPAASGAVIFSTPAARPIQCTLTSCMLPTKLTLFVQHMLSFTFFTI